MNMKKWLNDMIAADVKKPLPILSFPTINLMGVTVKELTSDADIQAKGMKAVADRVDSAASVSMMDLSVEAEAFGSEIIIYDSEVPAVTGAVAPDEDSAHALQVPPVGAGRTGLYVEAIKKAKQLITDRPLLAGIIGPFSLSGRLCGVSEAMMNCYDYPEMMHELLEKSVEFLTGYALAFKEVGADGIVMAEPLAGLLSPSLAEEFSAPYVKRIIDAVQDDSFIVIYHNCGSSTPMQTESILSTGAAGYHFGNAVSMKEMLGKFPSDVPVMGNIDPSSAFYSGTPEIIRDATISLMKECCAEHKNFIISSGCDIPPSSPWENIDAFFAAAKEFYEG